MTVLSQPTTGHRSDDNMRALQRDTECPHQGDLGAAADTCVCARPSSLDASDSTVSHSVSLKLCGGPLGAKRPDASSQSSATGGPQVVSAACSSDQGFHQRGSRLFTVPAKAGESPRACETCPSPHDTEPQEPCAQEAAENVSSPRVTSREGTLPDGTARRWPRLWAVSFLTRLTTPTCEPLRPVQAGGMCTMDWARVVAW